MSSSSGDITKPATKPKEEETTETQTLSKYLKPLAIVVLILVLALLAYAVWTRSVAQGLVGGFMKKGGKGWKGGCGCTASGY